MFLSYLVKLFSDTMGNSEESKVLKLLQAFPGLTKFEIAGKLQLESTKTQRILSDLQNTKQIISGLQKDEQNSVYERKYFYIL